MSEQRSVMQALRILLPLVPAKEKRRFIVLQVLSIVMALAELVLVGLVALLAAIFGSPEAVLDNNPVRWLRETLGISFGDNPRYLAVAALCVIFLCIVSRNILAIVYQRQTTAFSESVSAAARAHVFRFYQRAPFLWIVRNGVAELGFGLSAASHLAGTLNIALQVSSSVLMILTLFIGLVSISPVPSLMFLCVLGLGGILIVRITRKFLDQRANAVYTADFHLNRVNHLALHGLKEIRLYGREDYLFGAYTEHLGKIVTARVQQQTVIRLPIAGLETLGFATLLAVMLYLIFVQDAGMAQYC